MLQKTPFQKKYFFTVKIQFHILSLFVYFNDFLTLHNDFLYKFQSVSFVTYSVVVLHYWVLQLQYASPSLGPVCCYVQLVVLTLWHNKRGSAEPNRDQVYQPVNCCLPLHRPNMILLNLTIFFLQKKNFYLKYKLYCAKFSNSLFIFGAVTKNFNKIIFYLRNHRHVNFLIKYNFVKLLCNCTEDEQSSKILHNTIFYFIIKKLYFCWINKYYVSKQYNNKVYILKLRIFI